MSYYFSQEFKHGKIAEHLIIDWKYYIVTSEPYKIIVGLDIGNNKAEACVFYRNWNVLWTSLRQKLDKDMFVPISSLCDGNAENTDDFIILSKKSPDKWDEAFEICDGCKTTYGNLLKNYISRFYEEVKELEFLLRRPDGFSIKQEEILLVASCPDDEKWTSEKGMEAYRKLLSEATGYSENQIAILPESSAIIMGSIYDYIHANKEIAHERTDKTELPHSRGIVLCDAGATSMKITLLQPGKSRMVKRHSIGGIDIEKDMLKKIEKENAALCSHPAFYSHRPQILRELRRIKENFYLNGNKPTSCTISLPKEDNPDELDFFNHTINETFMNQVLENSGWMNRCEDFFGKVKAQIEGEPVAILVGGASSVSPLKKLYTDKFGEPVMADAHSGVVARGLCLAKIREFSIRNHISIDVSDMTKLENSSYQVYDEYKAFHNKEEEYYDEFLEEMAEILFDQVTPMIRTAVLKATQDAKNAGNNKPDLSHLVAAVSGAFMVPGVQEKIAKAIDGKRKSLYEEYCTKFREDIYDMVNRISEKIYTSRFFIELPLPENNISVTLPKNNPFINGLLMKLSSEAFLKTATTFFAANKYEKIVIAYKNCATEDGKKDLYEKQKKAIIGYLREESVAEELKYRYNKTNSDQLELALGKLLLVVTDEYKEM